MSLKILIVEDDLQQAKWLAAQLVLHQSDIKLMGIVVSVAEAIHRISNEPPDLILLDIVMPDATGFDLLSRLGSIDMEVIIITGHDRYAIQAIRCAAIDFLLKPVNTLELVTAIHKAREQNMRKQTAKRLEILLEHLQDHSHACPTIAVQLSSDLLILQVPDIIRCEASKSYTRIFLVSGESHLSSKGLTHFETILASYRFIRCHQSHLVNRKYIHSLRRSDNHELILRDRTAIPVSRLKVEDVKELLLGSKRL